MFLLFSLLRKLLCCTNYSQWRHLTLSEYSLCYNVNLNCFTCPHVAVLSAAQTTLLHKLLAVTSSHFERVLTLLRCQSRLLYLSTCCLSLCCANYSAAQTTRSDVISLWASTHFVTMSISIALLVHMLPFSLLRKLLCCTNYSQWRHLTLSEYSLCYNVNLNCFTCQHVAVLYAAHTILQTLLQTALKTALQTALQTTLQTNPANYSATCANHSANCSAIYAHYSANYSANCSATCANYSQWRHLWVPSEGDAGLPCGTRCRGHHFGHQGELMFLALCVCVCTCLCSYFGLQNYGLITYTWRHSFHRQAKQYVTLHFTFGSNC